MIWFIDVVTHYFLRDKKSGTALFLYKELSSITALVNDNLPQESHIRNRETKMLILSDLGNDVIFTQSEHNKSTLVHSKDYSQADIINQLRAIDLIRMYADQLRSALLEIDLILENSFEMVMPDS